MHLDLNTMLPIIRKAYNTCEIQEGVCYYDAPCAVGVCLPKDTRVSFDKMNNNTIAGILAQGLVTMPEDQREDWTKLQRGNDFGELDSVLTELEKKYGQP